MDTQISLNTARKFVETRGVVRAMAGSQEYDELTRKALKTVLTQP